MLRKFVFDNCFLQSITKIGSFIIVAIAWHCSLSIRYILKHSSRHKIYHTVGCRKVCVRQALREDCCGVRTEFLSSAALSLCMVPVGLWTIDAIIEYNGDLELHMIWNKISSCELMDKFVKSLEAARRHYPLWFNTEIIQTVKRKCVLKNTTLD